MEDMKRAEALWGFIRGESTQQVAEAAGITVAEAESLAEECKDAIAARRAEFEGE